MVILFNFMQFIIFDCGLIPHMKMWFQCSSLR
ncbi:hypothetical protein T11_2273 [Trichinella zimbabwensis]|uniref:Uncharacterized protein n=1 Tax=Trichinella zimbabwensis TaxID=268475 RepID=A0A0V1GCK2_9BILA|nr:hypothetical protein T11_2273 [Trichinella zimbabwensis]